MDWQTAQNWLVFLPVVGALGWYYMPRPTSSAPDQGRRGSLASNKRSDEPQEGRAKAKSRPTSGREKGSGAQPAQDSNEKAKKRKTATKEQTQPTAVTPSVVVQNDEPEEVDMSTKQFAMQMAKARKGAQIGASKDSSKDRVKTVKLGSAKDTPEISSGSSQADADADDDMSPAASPGLHAGDVSDMLEPKGSGPSTLRLTAPTVPQKEKKARQAKEETVLTKKQRQNRKRVEEQREQRLEEEKQRKALEESQRRAARISRGEPAKNGIPVAKPPANNAWTGPKAAVTETATNGNHNAPMLDTFDAESTSSSNGGMGASTAATSTASGPTQKDRGSMSEEDQMAMAVRQSEDESGWTEVAAPKKSTKKKPEDSEAVAAVKPVASKASAPAVKSNGKPKGFQALEDELQQRTDVDPNDASNWDA